MNRKVGIITAVVAAFIVTYVVADQVFRWHRNSVDEVVEQEKAKWQDDVAALKEEVAALKEAVGDQDVETDEGNVSPDKTEVVYGENRKVIKKVRKTDSCVKSRAVLDAFFTDLDEKGYLETYGQKGSSREFFIGMMKVLAEKPPVVADERATPLRLMRNMFHFYRVMGREKVQLVAHILKSESKNLEGVLHAWYTLAFEEGGCLKNDSGKPSLEAVYEYAGYFLNTLGGKSYLVRRDSRLRILVSYYSVLSMDLANREKLNQYGIDIRPHLKMLENDLVNYRGLVMRKHYISTINSLEKNYL